MMRSLMYHCLLCAGILATPVCVFAQAPSDNTAKQIGPGVTWQHQFIESEPRNLNIMKIDVSDPRITLETESGQDKLFAGEKVLASVKREAEPARTNIIGAVNADFWSAKPRPFTPIGLLVADGMIYNMPAKSRSAFVFTEDEKPYIGKVTLDVSLKTGSQKLKVDRINSGLKSDSEIVLFTPPYGEVGPAGGKRYLLSMRQAEFLPNKPVTVRISALDAGSSVVLTPNTMVLHLPEQRVSYAEKNLDTDKPGELIAILPQVDGVVRSVCGGGPALLRNGEVSSDMASENFGKSFEETRHPRTALGITRDDKTIILLTVDGRQPRLSIGASLAEMANYMKDLGCWDAINLDGGGSSTMVVGDKVVNKPSDLAGPRTVANSLLVVELLGDHIPSSALAD